MYNPGGLSVVELEPTLATFSGAEFLHYNYTTHGDASASTEETVRLSFKTSFGNGLLFYTGMYPIMCLFWHVSYYVFIHKALKSSYTDVNHKIILCKAPETAACDTLINIIIIIDVYYCYHHYYYVGRTGYEYNCGKNY